MHFLSHVVSDFAVHFSYELLSVSYAVHETYDYVSIYVWAADVSIEIV